MQVAYSNVVCSCGATTTALSDAAPPPPTPSSSSANPSPCGVSVPDAGIRTCPNIMFEDPTFGTLLGGCCLDDGTCGVGLGYPAAYLFNNSGGIETHISGGCQPLHQAGTPDSSCPGVSILNLTFPGCCRSDGTCGIDLTRLGAGCAKEEQYAGNPDPDGGPAAPLLPPQRCGGS